MKRSILTAAFAAMLCGQTLSHSQINDLIEKRTTENQNLVWALRTRLLTEAEMQKVKFIGVMLFEPYHDVDQAYSLPWNADAQLNELLLQQFKLRRVAEELRKHDPCAGGKE